MRTQANPVDRRAEYSEATKKALLEAATQAFTEDGYQQASTEAIARSAGVTRGAFYHHYADKKALFEAVVLLLQHEAVDYARGRARGGAAVRDRLSLGALAFLDFAARPAYSRIVIQESPAVLGAPRCREISEDTVLTPFIDAFRNLKSNGQITVKDATLAAHMIAAMICEAALSMTRTTRRKLVREQAEAIIGTMLRAMSTGD